MLLPFFFLPVVFALTTKDIMGMENVDNLLAKERVALQDTRTGDIRTSLFADFVRSLMSVFKNEELSEKEKQEHLWFFFRPEFNEDVKEFIEEIPKQLRIIRRFRTIKFDQVKAYQEEYLKVLAEKYLFCGDKNATISYDKLEKAAKQVDAGFIEVHNQLLGNLNNSTELHINCNILKNTLLNSLVDQEFPLRLDDQYKFTQSQEFGAWMFKIPSYAYNEFMNIVASSLKLDSFIPTYGENIVKKFRRALGPILKSYLVADSQPQKDERDDALQLVKYELQFREKISIELLFESITDGEKYRKIRLQALEAASLIGEKKGKTDKLAEFLKIYPNATLKEKDDFEIDFELFQSLRTKFDDKFGPVHVRVFEQLFLHSIYTRIHGLYGEFTKELSYKESMKIAQKMYLHSDGVYHYEKKLEQMYNIIEESRKNISSGRTARRLITESKDILNSKKTLNEKLDDFKALANVDVDHPAFEVFLNILHFVELRNIYTSRYGEKSVATIEKILHEFFEKHLSVLSGAQFDNAEIHITLVELVDGLTSTDPEEHSKLNSLIRDLETSARQYYEHLGTTSLKALHNDVRAGREAKPRRRRSGHIEVVEQKPWVKDFERMNFESLHANAKKSY